MDIPASATGLIVTQVGILAAIVANAVVSALRENRTRRNSLADAAALAKELREKNEALATKVAADAADVLAKAVAEALKVAEKVNTAAEKLADKVRENTQISTEAVRGAQSAFTEANTQNAKIINLGEQVTGLSTQVGEIMHHVKDMAAKNEDNDRRIKEDNLLHATVKAAIEEKLREMNGHTTHQLQTRKRNRKE